MKLPAAFKTNRAFSDEQKKEQIHAVVCNHKRVTVRGVCSITGFDAEFIEKTLNEFSERGTFNKRPSYVLDGDTVHEECWRVRKKFLQTDIFGQAETEDDEENIA